MKMKNQDKYRSSRRRLIKTVASGAGVVFTAKSLPRNWSTPAIQSVVLPAHAEMTGEENGDTTPPPSLASITCTYQGTCSPPTVMAPSNYHSIVVDDSSGSPYPVYVAAEGSNPGTSSNTLVAVWCEQNDAGGLSLRMQSGLDSYNYGISCDSTDNTYPCDSFPIWGTPNNTVLNLTYSVDRDTTGQIVLANFAASVIGCP